MVIRRGNQQSFEMWKMHEGSALGWSNNEHPDLDPDQYRRLINRKLIKPKIPEPLYSGEMTHPLQASLVETENGTGKTRKRTLLSGFLTLGGTVEANLESVNDEGNSDEIEEKGERTISTGGLAINLFTITFHD